MKKICFYLIFIFLLVTCISCDKAQQSNKNINSANNQNITGNNNKKKDTDTIALDNNTALKSMNIKLIDTFTADTSANGITYTSNDYSIFKNGPESFFIDPDKTIYILNTPSKNIIIKNSAIKVININFTCNPINLVVSKGRIYVYDYNDTTKKIYALDTSGNLIKIYDITCLKSNLSSRFILLNNNEIIFYIDDNKGITLESLEKKNFSVSNSILTEKKPSKSCTFNLSNSCLDINVSDCNNILRFISSERELLTFRPISIYPDLVFNSELLNKSGSVNVKNIILAYKQKSKETYVYEFPLDKSYSYPNSGNYFFMSADQKLYIMICEEKTTKIYQLIY